MCGSFTINEAMLTSGLCFSVTEPAVVQASLSNMPFPCGTILVVEDEPSLRELTCGALDRYGYTVLAAEDAADALRTFTQHEGEISLVVTDLSMPGMNGTDLIRHLRARYDGLKAILVSGYDEGSFGYIADKEQCAFLQKPFTTETLLRKVREMMDATDYPSESSSVN